MKLKNKKLFVETNFINGKFVESKKKYDYDFVDSFSVVIPSYNENHNLLYKTIESVIKQDVFVPFEM